MIFKETLMIKINIKVIEKCQFRLIKLEQLLYKQLKFSIK